MSHFTTDVNTQTASQLQDDDIAGSHVHLLSSLRRRGRPDPRRDDHPSFPGGGQGS